ncbi:MAG: hypothetical protein GWN07_29590, partial [Actinobacteria bacterium]|nr:hypothetical protein [Actinomycetota bacterium]NIX23752.1 hypothetical protein [Actinomycetota bacterium]
SFLLDENPPGPGNVQRLFIEFEVERATPAVTEEGLVGADRTIEASVELEAGCAPGETFTASTGTEELPLREPVPEIVKQGRNVDAAQTAYADTVYGHRHDGVIWRIQVGNLGLAPLEDVIVSDVIGPGFEFEYVCPSDGEAESAADGAPPGACQPLPDPDTITDLALADVLGGPGSVVDPGGTAEIFLVGTITDSCIVDTINTASNLQWGCAVEAPPGGISQTSTGIVPADAIATLNTEPTPSGLDVDVALTGTNTSQPMGSKGTVNITVTNQTGGTVRDIRLRNLLPAEYVVDPTFDPTVAIARPPGHGASYAGMIDEIAWTNPEPGTSPLTSTDPADPLANIEPRFELTSSTSQSITEPDPDPSRYRNMLRHGDVMTVTFRTILVDPTYYDKVANVDVVEEEPGGSPSGTDPAETFSITNELEIWFEELCTGTEHSPSPLVTDDVAEPEDLDVDTSAPIYILTNTDP